MDEEYLKKRLHEEIDRMSDSQIRNLERSQNSFWDWITRTAKRIWNAVVDGVIVSVGKWLWGLFFG